MDDLYNLQVSSSRLQSSIATTRNVLEQIQVKEVAEDPWLDLLFGQLRDGAGGGAAASRSYQVEAITGIIVGSPAKVREYPAIDSREVAIAQENEEVTVLLRHGDWYAIVLSNRSLGYIFRDLIRLNDQPHKIEPIVADPALQSEYFLPTVPTLRSTSTDLRTAVNEMTVAVEEEQPSFESPAFSCRSDLQQCRMEYAYLDCELTMIACLVSVITGGS